MAKMTTWEIITANGQIFTIKAEVIRVFRGSDEEPSIIFVTGSTIIGEYFIRNIAGWREVITENEESQS